MKKIQDNLRSVRVGGGTREELNNEEPGNANMWDESIPSRRTS